MDGLANTGVVFLNVSIDKKPEAWKKAVDRHTDLKGQHILLTGENLTSFLDSYLIGTIPRYILINKDGHIADINSPRPSSGLVKEQIIKLIND
jgi:hypothetical protein